MSTQENKDEQDDSTDLLRQMEELKDRGYPLPFPLNEKTASLEEKETVLAFMRRRQQQQELETQAEQLHQLLAKHGLCDVPATDSEFEANLKKKLRMLRLESWKQEASNEELGTMRHKLYCDDETKCHISYIDSAKDANQCDDCQAAEKAALQGKTAQEQYCIREDWYIEQLNREREKWVTSQWNRRKQSKQAFKKVFESMSPLQRITLRAALPLLGGLIASLKEESH